MFHSNFGAGDVSFLVRSSSSPLVQLHFGRSAGENVPVPRLVQGYPSFFRQSGAEACAEWLPVDLKLSKYD
jgi:hypothetical protein